MTKEELQLKINLATSKQDICDIVDEIMAIPVPWFFVDKFKDKSLIKYQEFKTYMSKKFDVPAAEVFICGSAWLGFSLDPEKHFSNFHNKSDIEIVIISNKHFKTYWKQFFEDYAYSELYGYNLDYISRNVFKHFIDFHNKYVERNRLYQEWEKKTSGYVKDLQIKFDFPEIIGYRIYSSFEDYRLNLIKNIYAIKNTVEVQ